MTFQLDLLQRFNPSDTPRDVSETDVEMQIAALLSVKVAPSAPSSTALMKRHPLVFITFNIKLETYLFLASVP